ENPKWAGEQSMAATRVHIRSLPYGWIWFIPLGPTRTSIGLVTPADHYKKTGKRPADLYREALQEEPFVRDLLEGAESREMVETTTDWSYVVDRTYGDNWFLVGEVAGFADPILAAGMTLTQTGARELAYTILELERGEHERGWLLERYDELQRRRVRQHMRFAEYWYSANGVFENIRENCSAIAEEAGLKLNPVEAFRWLAQGGLGDDVPGQVGIGGLDVAGVKQVMVRLTGDQATWKINGKNIFKLNLQGAKKVFVGRPDGKGRIDRAEAYVRGPYKLELIGVQKTLFEALQKSSEIEKIMEHLKSTFAMSVPKEHMSVAINHAIQALEVMANDYWVHCSVRKGRSTLNVGTPEEGAIIHSHDPEGKMGRKVAPREATAS
ncbi:MAG: NAD(P)/FAD-dependent oxidoreductase, partial [Phycisphaerales bacterium]